MWSSERRLLAALPAALLGLGAARLDAQGAVRGAVALVESAGGSPADLRGAVVWLVPRGAPARAGAAGAAGADTIAMRGREFLPHVLPVAAGRTVAFPNRDPFSHNVFSNADQGPFDLGLYRRGATRGATFARPGVYPIYCNIHSKMVSFVVAVPTPWVAQPAADGGFALAGVPPGRYVLHAWHERAAATAQQEVAVPADAPVRVVLDARAWVAGPHLNKYGRPYAATRADRY